ncbi:MAG: 5-formyltetrahydrofolate cyclo-ligase [Flavobacterium sp.]
MLKKEIRIKYKNLRKELTENDIEDKSLAIANRLLSLNIWDKIYYHTFLSITELREINTEYILHILSGKDKEIIVSRTAMNPQRMIHFLLTENTKIKKNSYNIPEPVDGIEVPSHKIDIVFIPLLAFDKKGNRVGYGKGFYDNFLAECKPETIKIGLSFFEVEEEIEDISENDIRLNYCVTPSKVYSF